jgi:cell shape-determining protein MreD
MGDKKRILYKWSLYAVLTFTVLSLQLGIMPYLSIWQVHPWLPPLLLGVVITFEKSSAAAVYGLIIGTWCDAFTPKIEIFHALLYLFAGLFAARLTRYLFRKTFVTALIWTTGFFAVSRLLFFIVFYYIPGRGGFDVLWRVALPEIVISLPFLPLLYLIGRAVHRRWSEEE